MAMNRREKRSWDKYVSEARETFAEVELPNGETLTVYIPTADAIAGMSESADLWTQIDAIMGTENANKLREHAGDAPVTALRGLLSDVMDDLGLSDNPGE